MKNKTAVSRKLVCAALFGALCAAPVIGVTAAKADPPHMHHHELWTVTGVVTDVISDQKFDIRINGNIYNVYPRLRTPRLLHKGQIVSVTGRRHGRNDIRDATVTVLHGNHH